MPCTDTSQGKAGQQWGKPDNPSKGRGIVPSSPSSRGNISPVFRKGTTQCLTYIFGDDSPVLCVKGHISRWVCRQRKFLAAFPLRSSRIISTPLSCVRLAWSEAMAGLQQGSGITRNCNVWGNVVRAAEGRGRRGGRAASVQIRCCHQPAAGIQHRASPWDKS